MANKFYPKGLQHFADGDISWSADTIKVLLVTSSYSPNFSTDEFLSDISGGTIVATSGALASKTLALGVLNAANVTFTAVSGSAASYVVIYKHTGTGSTSNLLINYDTGTGIPVTPNGGDITVNWDTGANKIGALFQGLGDLDREQISQARRLLRWVQGRKWTLTPTGVFAPSAARIATQEIWLPSAV